MGNVYMEADQVRFKNSTYHNLQTAVSAALEGGGGGGTTVVANPEGAATADLAKLQVGQSVYGVPATAAKIAYDNTSSGLTADDVQEAIDELSAAMPGVATTSAPGIVQPDGTTITITDGVISAAGGSSAGEVYSTTPVKVGSWLGSDLYRVVISAGAMPSGESGDTVKEVSASIITGRCVMAYLFGQARKDNTLMFLPYTSISQITNCITWRYVDNASEGKKFIVSLAPGNDQSDNNLYIIAYFTNA